MADQDVDDFDEQLAMLAGISDKKRKRDQQGASSSKRRKADADNDGESEHSRPESEDDMDNSNPYPLEGRYVDEADRTRLMSLPEIEREAILAQRQEEMQGLKDSRALDQILQQQRGGSSDEGVSKAAKRPHGIRGATKEKTRKLDELKAKRKAKDEKKRTRNNSPKRDRSSSPMDMETSDGEDEDGQITKTDLEDERDRRIFGQDAPEDDRPINIEDLRMAWITRDMIAKYFWAPWFEEFVKGGWVRFLAPPAAGGEASYRLCEVQSVSDLQGDKPVKPYRLNDQMVHQVVELKHGASSRVFPMDKISNTPFIQPEFDHLVRTYEHDKLKLPTKRQLEKKKEQLIKLSTQPMTEGDVAAMLAKKQTGKPGAATNTVFERSRLQHARTLAIKRNDMAEVAELDGQLAELAAKMPQRDTQADSSTDMLAKLNERNRMLNLAQIRQAERAEADRKRQRSNAAIARLKAQREAEASRSNTPGTPAKDGASTSGSPAGTPARDGPNKKNGMSFEASILQTVEIDIGDF